MLTGCGGFNTIEKSSNEVLGTLQPYLSAEDQETLDQLAESFDAPITIRENVLNGASVEIEILGNVAQLEIVNDGSIAFRLNGRNVTFDDLGNSQILEEIIMNSLIHISGGSFASTMLSANQSQAFFGGPVLSTVFRLVLTGIYNYTMSNIDPGLGQIIDPIVTPIIDNVTGGNTGNQNNQGNAGSGNWLGNILGTVVGAITGNLGNNQGNNQNPAPNPGQAQPPAQNQGCNTIFCGLLNLFTAVVFN